MKSPLIDYLYPALLIVSLIGLVKIYSNQTKIVSVNYKMVFEKFDMKLELEKTLNQSKQFRQQILDSMLNRVVILSDSLDKAPNKPIELLKSYEKVRSLYDSQRDAFINDNEVQLSESNQRILKQMRQYLNEFGQSISCDIVVGNDENGSVLYCSDELDFTKQAIDFVNNRYNGKNK
jgi:Skp family chaperone for outer membrane proteins